MTQCHNCKKATGIYLCGPYNITDLDCRECFIECIPGTLSSGSEEEILHLKKLLSENPDLALEI